jgi:hypothetical protein
MHAIVSEYTVQAVGWSLRCWSFAGDLFLTLADVLKLHPEFAPLRQLYTKAGLDDEVLAMRGKLNSITVFAPTGMLHQAVTTAMIVHMRTNSSCRL